MAKGFAADVTRYVERIKGDVDRAIRTVALGVLANVVQRTPVDTGRARANWQVGLGSPAGGSFPGGVRSSGAVVARERRRLQAARAGDVIYISNNLPYILRLEYGWSQQAPNGMVRVTMQALPEILKGVMTK